MTKTSETKYIVVVGLFSAIAVLLQYIGSATGLKVGGFLDVEISDLPPLILSFFYGPVAGILCEFIKNLLHLAISHTGFVGELANFIINGTMCLVVGLIYKHKRTFKGAILSLAAGTLVMAVVGIFANLYILLPLYMKDASFQDRLSLAFSLIFPFNIVKGIVISIITMLVYKRVGKLIRK